MVDRKVNRIECLRHYLDHHHLNQIILVV
jgi:hypothetical protein